MSSDRFSAGVDDRVLIHYEGDRLAFGYLYIKGLSDMGDRFCLF